MQINQLPERTSPDLEDAVAVDNGGATQKSTLAKIGRKIADSISQVFTSGDTASPTEWQEAPVMQSGLALPSLLARISQIVSNVRYLKSVLTWRELAKSSFQGTAANTWEYVGLSMTVPAGKCAIAFFRAIWGNGAPVGIAISTSNTAVDGAHTVAIYEWDYSTTPGRTTAIMLLPGTYYMHVKRYSVPGTANDHFCYGIMIP